MAESSREFNGTYTGQHLARVAFPMGGIGAGMLCIEGTGALSHVSVRNRPDVFNEPQVFAAIGFKGRPDLARVLEGPVPEWKAYGPGGAANGLAGKTWGLARFRDCTFRARFPFAHIEISDPQVPVKCEITGWSPFIPGNADDSSVPVAGLEYKLTNTSGEAIDSVFSFNSSNFMATGGGGESVTAGPGHGFVLRQPAPEGKPWDEGSLAVSILDDSHVLANLGWFRGGWFDPLTMAWNHVQAADAFDRPAYDSGRPSPGATLFVPVQLGAGESRTIRVLLAWYCPNTNLREGAEPQAESDSGAGCACSPASTEGQHYRPFYTSRFANVEEAMSWWGGRYSDLRNSTSQFTATFYDSTLPPEVLEAVAANLGILKSPTVLRQHDGRLWAWEGCWDGAGCCAGSCTHVWNYAQAIPHLFPSLERTLRETEFCISQDTRGHQTFRTSLPIRPTSHGFHAASDGQLGGVMKAFREWRISGDTEWLKCVWPRVRESLDYCIAAWDPDHTGVLMEPHHNTYDIEFWGPDGMCSSFYLGALQAAVVMAEALGEDAALYKELRDKGARTLENDLFNGEYFNQKIMLEGLRAKPPVEDPSYSPEAVELLRKEGPKYQYGNGCLSDGILGAWIAEVCGVPEFLDSGKVRSTLKSIHRYNFRQDLMAHSNPQRPTFAYGNDPGLLLCTWPHGDQLSLPFVYSNEVWTGIEYQAASHMIMMGLVDEGLEVVRGARTRYDGRYRNPFDEYECGHWYARAMASYGLLQALSGARYDAVEKTLYLKPVVKGDFRAFISTEGGYGIVGVRNGEAFLDVVSGEIPVEEIDYQPAR